MDVWQNLVQGIHFKERQKDESIEQCRTKTVNRRIKENSRDPEESANLFRKQNNIRVLGNVIPRCAEGFGDLEKEGLLPRSICQSLPKLGLERPTAVQSQVLPLLLQKRDVLAISPTGSGKTLAFAIPILAGLVTQQEHKSPFALLLAPTRELVSQTARVVEAFTPFLGTKLVCSTVTQASAAGSDFSKVDVVVSTPMRLRRMVSRKRIDLTSVQFLVIDEADKLLEMNKNPHTAQHVHQVDKVMGQCTHPDLVTGIFSATIPEAVESLARSFLKDPVRVTVGARNAAASIIQQQLQFAGSEEGKILLLQQLLAEGLKAPVLIFVASKEKAVLLQRKLTGYRVDSIFSNKDYKLRQSALDTFRSGKTWLLISTDVLARGIDFVNIQTVVNYDCPASLDDYVHRIGRTGRVGNMGAAVTFFTEDDSKVVRSIAHMIAGLGQTVPQWMLGMSKKSPDKQPKRRRKHTLRDVS